MYTIGTAGHVDHGKSALVKALTGIDPDRLLEEKERGLTIELGFAELTLPDGVKVSLVDVPGHERFIKTMLAGVGGIDLALLVIAADDGVMPQTREHLAIIDLLAIERGVIALSKSDLADSAKIAEQRMAIGELVSGTVLEASPIVSCSAATGDGLPALVRAIETQLASAPARMDRSRPRLPIDRAFTMPGFGTVVTGTLGGGLLSVGDEVDIMPRGRTCRIRGLQVHGRAVDAATPGRRTAVNLAGVTLDDVKRGDVLARRGQWHPTVAFDARLRTVTWLQHPIRHNSSVTVHLGSSEVPGRLVLLDAESVEPGEPTWAQFRLDAPLVATAGDRFIVRDSNDTLAGGVILDIDASRHKRSDRRVLSALEALHNGSPADAVMVSINKLQPATLVELAERASVTAEIARETADHLIRQRRIVCLDESLGDEAMLVTVEWLASASQRVLDEVSHHHATKPLRRGIPSEELRRRVGLSNGVLAHVIASLAASGLIEVRDADVTFANHAPALDTAQRTTADAYLAQLAAAPYAPPTDVAPNTDLVSYLVDSGAIVDVGGGVVFSSQAFDEMVRRIQQTIAANGQVTLAEVRDMFGTTRKYAQSLLEHLDTIRVTRRVGDVRVLGKQPRESD